MQNELGRMCARDEFLNMGQGGYQGLGEGREYRRARFVTECSVQETVITRDQLAHEMERSSHYI